jgi:hypothetical protein
MCLRVTFSPPNACVRPIVAYVPYRIPGYVLLKPGCVNPESEAGFA